MSAIPIPTAYLGSSLPATTLLEVGDFLMSPNGRFCAQLQPNGLFGVYWNATDAVIDPPPRAFRPSGAPLWSTEITGPRGDYFLVMQTDGNLCIYPGTNFQNRGPCLWKNDRYRPSGAYVLHLLDNGQLRVTRDGANGWGTPTNVIEYPLGLIISGVSDKTTYKTLSSHSPPPSKAGAGTQVVVESPGLSVTDVAAESGGGFPPATPDQLWKRLDWYDGATFVATVLINHKRRWALCWDGKEQTDLTAAVLPSSMWTFGEKERGDFRAIRPSDNETVNLNVKGDAPYPAGTEVILWRWTPGGADNLIWTFFYGDDDRPSPS